MNQTFKIHEFVKFYCIPSQEDSKKILEELLDDLVIEIYEKKSCRRDIQYVLLTEQGKEIHHISEIYFSTQELLLVSKEFQARHYLRYREMIEERDRSLKMTLPQSIKHNFVEKIVNQQIDNNKINYQEDPQ